MLDTYTCQQTTTNRLEGKEYKNNTLSFSCYSWHITRELSKQINKDISFVNAIKLAAASSSWSVADCSLLHEAILTLQNETNTIERLVNREQTNILSLNENKFIYKFIEYIYRAINLSLKSLQLHNDCLFKQNLESIEALLVRLKCYMENQGV